MDPLMDSHLRGVDEDLAFTADISTHMRVPDRLSFAGGFAGDLAAMGPGADPDIEPGANVRGMQLADKILVAGADRHIELSGAIMEPMDGVMPNGGVSTKLLEGVNIAPPPSVLRVDEARFPEMSVDEDDELTAELSLDGRGDGFRRSNPFQKNTEINFDALLRRLPPGSHPSAEPFPEDEQLQQRLAGLERRLRAAEADIAFFQSRDKVLLPILGVYALIKLVRFFLGGRN